MRSCSLIVGLPLAIGTYPYRTHRGLRNRLRYIIIIMGVVQSLRYKYEYEYEYRMNDD